MPTKPKRPCNHVGCRNLTTERFCPEHKAEEYRRQDRARGKTAERGYGYRWQKYRVRFLREHPLCAECKKQGRLTPATVVDHIVPHKGDMDLFWDTTNHQALCKQCHDRKTAREDGGFGRK